MRIGLETAPYTSLQEATITCTSDHVVIDLDTNAVMAEREAGSVWIATTRPSAGSEEPQAFRIRVKPLGPDGLVRFVAPASHRDRYRGVLDVCTTATGTLSFVNELPIEDYLRGVAPAEMPTSFQLEDPKAQAIAARTFAVSSRGSHGAKNCGLCDGCQRASDGKDAHWLAWRR